LRSIDPEVGEICKSAANKFALMGCTVDDDIPDFSGAIESFQVLRALLFADVRGELLPKEKERINPDIVWNIEKGLNLSVNEIIQARRTRHDLFHQFARFFDNHDLLICPTVAVSAFPIEQRFPTEINGEILTSYIDWMYLTFVITLVGCPAISIPCGLNKEGLPVGLQLIGRPHGDAQLLGYARLLEQAIAFDASAAFLIN
jgi:amidase